MKKFFGLIAFSAIILASCQKQTPEISPLEGETEEVTFSIALPEVLETKAISDGTKATTLYVAVYYQGTHLPSRDQVVTMTNLKADVVINLVKNIPYDVVFWAQDSDCNAYTLDKANHTLTVDYKGDANDDKRDAFYFCVEDYVLGQTDKENVYLRRPFAQINFGATDYSYFEEIQNVNSLLSMTSTIDIDGLPNVLNLLNGTVSGTAATSFAPTAIPDDSGEKLQVGTEDYAYISMNYVLAPTEDNQKLTTVNATFAYAGSDVKWNVVDVPYKRNYRTNIIGNLFTENVEFKVIILPGFSNDFPTIDPTL